MARTGAAKGIDCAIEFSRTRPIIYVYIYTIIRLFMEIMMFIRGMQRSRVRWRFSAGEL